MESLVFNASFITYVLINNTGLDILDVLLIDQSEVRLKNN